MAKAATVITDPRKQLEDDFRSGKIDFAQLGEALEALNRKPIEFGVGDKGWLKVKVDGCRYPVNMPYEVAVDLFSEEGAAKARQYLASNKGRFKLRGQR